MPHAVCVAVMPVRKLYSNLIVFVFYFILQDFATTCSACLGMSYCCVPLCKSSGKKNTGALSFHEIPAAAGVRERWLAAIRRDNWSPNTTSNYTRVCSRHFQPEDFIEGKRRRLKKDAVPSVFADYPSHLQPKVTTGRSMASITKRDRAVTEQSTCTSSNAASRPPPCATLTLGPEAKESEPMDTTSAAGETMDNYSVHCHSSS